MWLSSMAHRIDPIPDLWSMVPATFLRHVDVESKSGTV